METMEILKIALVILVGYFVLKFIWNAVSGIIKLIVVIVIIGVGVYFVKPELLHDVFGKDKVENVASDIKKDVKSLTSEGLEKLDSITDDITDDVKENAKNKLDTVTN